MKNQNITATTVKLDHSIYDSFKILGIPRRLTLQKFVEKCVHLYVGEESFRSVVDNFITPVLSINGTGSFGV
jgi:hypothetical protein